MGTVVTRPTISAGLTNVSGGAVIPPIDAVVNMSAVMAAPGAMVLLATTTDAIFGPLTANLVGSDLRATNAAIAPNTNAATTGIHDLLLIVLLPDQRMAVAPLVVNSRRKV